MLELKTEERDGVPIISLTGELDFSRVDMLEKELAGAEEGRPALLVLDLRELSFIDSGGVRGIVHAHQRAADEGRQLAVIKGNDRVHRVFEWTGLTRSLTFFDAPPWDD